MCIWRQCNKDPSAALGMTVLGERIDSQGWCAVCLEDGILVSQPSPLRNTIKLSGRTFLAPHRGSSPKGLCKRTGFLGVKRRENPVRLHILPSALPPKGEARRYAANDFLNLIALPGRWLPSIISAILNASHCNSSHENRDKKEVPYGFHHYLLWFCRSKHDRALSLQMA